MKILQNLQSYRVRVRKSYKTYRTVCTVRLRSEGYENHTKLTELSGKGMKIIQNSQNCRVRYENLTKLTELSGKGMKFIQNLQNCRVEGRRTFAILCSLPGTYTESYIW